MCGGGFRQRCGVAAEAVGVFPIVKRRVARQGGGLVKRAAIFQLALIGVLSCSSCLGPRVAKVKEPVKQDSVGGGDVVQQVADEGDQPRVPDMMNQLPDERDFQPTNPAVATGGSQEGTMVAKPPSAKDDGKKDGR